MTSSGAVQGDNMNDPWNYHRCKLCSYKTRFLHCILRHVRRHRTRSKDHRFTCDLHSPEVYRCQRCEFQTDLKVLLTEHFDTVHRAKETRHYPTPLIKYCEKCDFETCSFLVLLRHDSCCHRSGLPAIKDENTIECENGKVHSNPLKDIDEKESRRKRRRKHSNELTRRNQKKKEFVQCNYCSFKTKFKSYMKLHVIRRHTPDDQINWLECEQCKNKFKDKHTLRNHVLKEKHCQLKCDLCPYETSKEQHMKAHITLCKKYSFKCEHCSFKAKYERNLAKHVLVKHPETVGPKKIRRKYLRCELCCYRTASRRFLNWHETAMHPSLRERKELKKYEFFHCCYCPYETKFIGSLKSHMFLRHTPASQTDWCKCIHCSYKTKTKIAIVDHVLSKHSEITKIKRFRCDQCPYETFGEENMKVHMTLCKKHSFKCEHCSYESVYERNLVIHLLAQHSKSAGPETAVPKKRKLKHYECNHCSHKGTIKSEVERHIRDVHDPLDCGLPEKDGNSIECGIRENHSNRLTRAYEKMNGLFRCSYCSYKTKVKGSLKSHVIFRHTPADQIDWCLCPHCSFKAKRKYNLRRHILSAHSQFAEIKLFKCDLCPYKTFIEQTFKAHISLCQKNSFQCEHCSFITKHEEYLGEHMLQFHPENIEPNELKVFKCDNCRYETLRKELLEKHLLNVHTPPEQINWFKCEFCSFRANEKWNMDQHMLALHPETIVSKKSKLSFARHKVRKLRWFKCGQCTCKVNNNGALRRHILLKHSPSDQVNLHKSDRSSYEIFIKDDLKLQIRRIDTSSIEIDCFKCELCTYKSKDKDDLSRHILAQHILETDKAQVFHEGVLISS